MCGICGFTGARDNTTLRRMAGAVLHRGPDDEGFYSDGEVNLGMRRLSIVDVATGSQPQANEDGTVQVVFNGEIYNARELRTTLESQGHSFTTDHSDTEVIVHLYEEHGIDFPRFLNGMFAIALWDAGRRRLLLVRDRMGVKPLFYAESGGRFVFGSEIKAVLAHPGIAPAPNREGLYHYFTFKHVPAPLTAFEGIFAVRPGEIVDVTPEGTGKRRWWRLQFHDGGDRDEGEVQEKLRALLDDATRLRMNCDVPYGSYLSGGVDSSSVVALMRRHASGPLKTFCLGYEDDLKNKEADLFHARRVAEHFGTDHHEYIMSHGELAEDLDDVIGAFDQPFAGVISTFFLSKLIARHVKVAFSGDGADELFGSYLSHRAAGPMALYPRLREKALAGGLSPRERAQLAPCDPAFLEDLSSRSGGGEVDWRYHLFLFQDAEKEKLLSRDFRNGMNGASSYRLLGESFRGLSAATPLNRILEMEWNTLLPDQVLAFVDFLSMAHSVEIRSPFLDYRVVEYAATIPGNLKIREGNVKDILKKAVAPLLPDGITARPKEGFVLPVYHWMRGGLADLCGDVLSAERLQLHGYFDGAAVRRLMERHGRDEYEATAKVWVLVMFQLWWEKYFA